MNDEAANKLISLMTMCRKAGKLLLGFDSVKEAAQQNLVHCVLLASDCASKTEKEIRYYCNGISCEKLPFPMQDMTAYFTKRTAVFGVTDSGFARAIRKTFAAEACDEQSLTDI